MIFQYHITVITVKRLPQVFSDCGSSYHFGFCLHPLQSAPCRNSQKYSVDRKTLFCFFLKINSVNSAKHLNFTATTKIAQKSNYLINFSLFTTVLDLGIKVNFCCGHNKMNSSTLFLRSLSQYPCCCLTSLRTGSLDFISQQQRSAAMLVWSSRTAL